MRIDVAFEAPIKLVSEQNQREHWSKKGARVRAQREQLVSHVSHLQVLPDLRFEMPKPPRRYAVARWVEPYPLPLIVTITRVAPDALDSDNLVGSAKAVRDQLAELLGVDDRDARVSWRVEQRRGGVREYAAVVHLVTRGASA